MLESYNDKSINQGTCGRIFYLYLMKLPPKKPPRGDTLDATCTSLSRIDPCHAFLYALFFKYKKRILRFFGGRPKNAILSFYDLA
jgi:hypothetical protein